VVNSALDVLLRMFGCFLFKDEADEFSIYQQAVKANGSISDTSLAGTLEQQCGNETLTNPSGVSSNGASSSSPASSASASGSASASTSPTAAGIAHVLSTGAIYGAVAMIGAVAAGGALVL
jgi:hypothetical protein